MKRFSEIPKDLYDEGYFLNQTSGGEVFIRSRGTSFAPKFLRVLQLAGDLENNHLLDIGSGRGDLVIAAAKRGAIATGCDFSPDAISLASKFCSHFLEKPLAVTFDLINNPSFKTDYRENQFDIVTCMDVLEHLTESQIVQLLREAYRILKVNGRLVIHTSPNLLYLRYGLFIDSLFTNLASRIIKELPRITDTRSPKDLHINEQTVFSLRRFLRSNGFRGKVWAEQTFTDRWDHSTRSTLLLRYFWRKVHKAAAPILCSELYAVCTKIR